MVRESRDIRALLALNTALAEQMRALEYIQRPPFWARLRLHRSADRCMATGDEGRRDDP